MKTRKQKQQQKAHQDRKIGVYLMVSLVWAEDGHRGKFAVELARVQGAYHGGFPRRGDLKKQKQKNRQGSKRQAYDSYRAHTPDLG